MEYRYKDTMIPLIYFSKTKCLNEHTLLGDNLHSKILGKHLMQSEPF